MTTPWGEAARLQYGPARRSPALRSRAYISSALALIVLGTLTLSSPTPVAAAGGITTTASTTYTLNPDAGRLDVAIDVIVSNSTSDTTSYVTCVNWYYDDQLGYYSRTETCPQTTSYYINDTYLWLEQDATSIKVSADKGSPKLSVAKRGDGFDQYRVSFASIYNGQTRKLHVTYRIVGGLPRSDSTTRIGKAFASFCVVANGIDGGSARLKAPSTFVMQADAHNGPFTATTSGGITTYQTGPLSSPLDFWACLAGDNPLGYTGSSLFSPSGRTIELQAWPEDPLWNDQIKAQIGEALGRLEQLMGRPLPGAGPIIVREVAAGELGAYVGTFDPTKMLAQVGEDLDQPGVVAHELSHAWFNDMLFDGRWLSEGSAGWAESTITGDHCPDPGAFPGTGEPNLSDWEFAGPRASRQELAVVGYQYDAACYIVSTLADRVGSANMHEVLAALLDHKIAYRSGGLALAGHGGPADWRDWLDAIDELGLVPAGSTDLDAAQRLVAKFGAAADTSLLPSRSKARAAYHRLAGSLDDWLIPEAVLRPLSEWRFIDATAAMDTEANAFAAVDAVEASLPEVGALDGPIKKLVESARTQSDLAKAAEMAMDQEAAAGAVAEARDNLDAPRGLLAQIGLLGADLQPALAAGIAAVVDIDLANARDQAALINRTLAGASDEGAIRVAIALGILLLVMVAAGLLLRRRRSNHRTRAMIASPMGPQLDELPSGSEALLIGSGDSGALDGPRDESPLDGPGEELPDGPGAELPDGPGAELPDGSAAADGPRGGHSRSGGRSRGSSPSPRRGRSLDGSA